MAILSGNSCLVYVSSAGLRRNPDSRQPIRSWENCNGTWKWETKARFEDCGFGSEAYVSNEGRQWDTGDGPSPPQKPSSKIVIWSFPGYLLSIQFDTRLPDEESIRACINWIRWLFPCQRTLCSITYREFGLLCFMSMNGNHFCGSAMNLVIFSRTFSPSLTSYLSQMC